ncbi:MAG: YgeY family selenium metabolism-linked hydrolase [Telmatospirillum sp.]|nr:YgeY family selenium metabolism-linked hydrolase [Telmatospirillum sp.]
MITREREDEILALCQELIRIPSYSGDEKGVGQAIASFMERMGFDDIWTDTYGNVVGGVKGSRPGKTILFDGHIDTVPVKSEDWTRDPFGGERADGRIYGRGTSDMKGAVAAMLAACAYFAADRKRDFAGAAYVSCIVHEECFEGVAAREVSRRLKPDYVVIGEASELNLKKGQRGRAEIVLETFGKPAHSANPDAGINAVYRMSRLIDAVRTLPETTHPVLGKGILELTDIKSAPYPGASVVPDYCRATYDRRLLVGETRESVLKPLQDLIARLEAADPTFKARVSFAKGEETCYTGAAISGERFFPGWVYDEDHPWVATALAGLRRAGLNPTVTQYSFCTNGSHYAGEAGIPTIGFGPSRENLAHTIDEYVEETQLIGAASGYYGILTEALCK